MNKIDLEITLRDAAQVDLKAIQQIFNEVLMHTTATFEETPYTLNAWNEIFVMKQEQNLPFIVIEHKDEVIGYGTYGPFRKASGYKITMEHSLHVDKRFRSRGIGNAILAELIHRASLSGVENLVAAVDADNLPSIQIHKKFGFVETGRMPNVARKFSRNLTLSLLQLQIKKS